MQTIPNSLFGSKGIKTYSHDRQLGVIHKKISGVPKNTEIYATQFLISIPLKGSQRLKTFGNKSITINSLDMAIIPRGIYTVSDIESDSGIYESILVFMPQKFIDSFLSSHADSSNKFSHKKTEDVFLIRHNEDTKQYIKSLLAQLSNPMGLSANRMEMRLKELLELLYEIYGQELSHFLYAAKRLERKDIPTLMKNNVYNPLTIDDYAYLSGRSTASFRRDFQEEFGISPQNWILKERLFRAKNQLEQKDISVTNVAYQSGFNDLSYFTRQFKKKFGVTPGQYRTTYS